MSTTMTMRTPREVFEHHFAAFKAGDVDAAMTDYDQHSVVITPSGAARGVQAIREGVTMLLSAIPRATWRLTTQIYDGNILFLRWAADSRDAQINDGVETYLFKDGRIHIQTVHFTLQKKC